MDDMAQPPSLLNNIFWPTQNVQEWCNIVNNQHFFLQYNEKA
jgi:hypothetical protein